MAAASTNSSASRPMVPCGVVRWAVLSRVCPQGCPRCAVATIEPERLRSGPAIDRTARDWGPGCTAPAFRPPCAFPPRTKVRRSKDASREHESILRKGGARRATAAARRTTTSASSAAARASSAEPLDARRPRSGTPRRRRLRAAPSGPRPACGSSARSASPQVDLSAPCTDSAAATARRGPGTTAGRAAFVQLVAAAAAAFVEAAPAVRQSQNMRPET